MSFWNFNPWDKYDELIEGRHDHLFCAALSDEETGVEKVDSHTYILFGRVEALLMRPTSLVCRLGLDLYEAFVSLIDHE